MMYYVVLGYLVSVFLVIATFFMDERVTKSNIQKVFLLAIFPVANTFFFFNYMIKGWKK